MSRLRPLLAVALAAMLAAGPALAQQRAQPPRPAAPTTPAAKPGATTPPAAPVSPPEEPPPPYEPQLLRLAEILGALTFLRGLCGAGDVEEWRGRMNGLIETEAATKSRKETLAGAYNRGYRGFAQTYRTCTPSARLAIERYTSEGGKLAQEIKGRWSG